MLYIVATPIGNLGDISHRAIDILKSVSLIAAEDTRQTRKLTAHYGITTSLTSYFEHNKVTKAEYLIKLLKVGKDIALVSDSGTPGISDPGFQIIRLARQENIPVTAIPGPCALIDALILSGAPLHKFVFEGFLSSKSNARLKRLEELKGETRTIIFYESPYRVERLLEEIFKVYGDIQVVVARELTKKFEEILSNKVSELMRHFINNTPRGEFVVLIPGHA